MTPWVMRLIAANIFVFFVTGRSPALMAQLAFVPGLALTEPWRFVTYMFVHSGFGHIFFNMLGLYFFGPQLEIRLGEGRFLGLYFLSGIAGALLSIPVGYPIVGASAATFGVFLGFARYWPHVQVLIWGIVPVQARVLVVIMTLMSVFGTSGLGQPGIAHTAHLGGFLGGYLYLLWIERSSSAARFRARATALAPKATPSDLDRWKAINREAMHPVNREELERVFAKIDAGGPGTLTADERAFLNRFS